MRKYSLLLCGICFLIFAGCQSTQETDTLKASASEKVVRELTSEKYQGRMPGTEGNHQASLYIAKYLQNLQVKPYQDSYFHEYSQKVITDVESLFEIYYKNGTSEALTYGNDFFISYTVADFDEKMPINYYTKDTNVHNGWMIIDENGIIDKDKNDVTGFIEKRQAFLNSNKINTRSHYRDIQVSASAYQKLLDQELKDIHISHAVTIGDANVPNIVGLIEGSNSTKCVVISAHFDHVGMEGNSLFSGALDNASGVSALLATAEYLQQRSKEKPLDADIIIAAFNGEEMGTLGSKAFVDELLKSYDSIYNINIDSIGSKENEIYRIGQSDEVSMRLNEAFQSIMNEKDMGFICENISGDHMSFVEKGIPAVSLTSQEIMTYQEYHTTSDTYDMLNYEQIDKIGSLVASFIIDHDGDMFENGIEIDIQESVSDNGLQTTTYNKAITEEFAELIEDILLGKELKFNEEVRADIKASFGHTYYTYNEFLKLNPDIANNKSIGGYDLKLVMHGYLGTEFFYYNGQSAFSVYIYDKEYYYKEGHMADQKLEDSHEGYYLWKGSKQSPAYNGFMFYHDEYVVEVKIGNVEIIGGNVLIFDPKLSNKNDVISYIDKWDIKTIIDNFLDVLYQEI